MHVACLCDGVVHSWCGGLLGTPPPGQLLPHQLTLGKQGRQVSQVLPVHQDRVGAAACMCMTEEGSGE